MNVIRRFVFRGNASSMAGQIFRPKTIIVDVKGGASSLGVSGGRSAHTEACALRVSPRLM
jgi:hypothetical protein